MSKQNTDNISTISLSTEETTLQTQLIEALRKRIVLIQAQWIVDSKTIGNVFYATGFFIDSQILLTAAHNIYSYNYQKFAAIIRIYFITDSKQINQSHQKMKIVLKSTNFKCALIKDPKNKSNFQNDIAIIRVYNHTVNDQIKNLKDFICNKQKQQICYIIGYPDFYVREIKSFKQRQHLKKRIGPSTLTVIRQNKGIMVIRETEANHLFYKTKTVAGQSGSPVLIIQNGVIYLIGIHTSYSINKQLGRGIRFSQQIFNKIVGWSRQLVSQNKTIPYVTKQIEEQEQEEQKDEKIYMEQPHQFKLVQKYTTLANQQIIIWFDRINNMQRMLSNLKNTIENAIIDMEETCAKVITFQHNQIQDRFNNIMKLIDSNLDRFTAETKSFLQQKQQLCQLQKSRIQIYSNGISSEGSEIYLNSINSLSQQKKNKSKLKQTESIILAEWQDNGMDSDPSSFIQLDQKSSKNDSLQQIINKQLKHTQSTPVGK